MTDPTYKQRKVQCHNNSAMNIITLTAQSKISHLVQWGNKVLLLAFEIGFLEIESYLEH